MAAKEPYEIPTVKYTTGGIPTEGRISNPAGHRLHAVPDVDEDEERKFFYNARKRGSSQDFMPFDSDVFNAFLKRDTTASGVNTNNTIVESLQDTRIKHATFFKLNGEDHTAAGLICAYALGNPACTFAAPIKPHPLFNHIIIRIATDGTCEPKDIMVKALTGAMMDVEKLRMRLPQAFMLRKLADDEKEKAVQEEKSYGRDEKENMGPGRKGDRDLRPKKKMGSEL